MEFLQSIESLERENIKDTQTRPILVHASDLNFYYCKYHSFVGPANRLFKETLVASFLEFWNFHRSPTALLQVQPNHIPVDLGIVRRSFDVPCFAIQVISDVGDINHITENIIASSTRRREAKADILKIAFFDIWLCNEDRHSGNYNLLYKYLEGNYVIYPIDHEACFNHGNFERGLDLIDYESSLIYSSFFSKLFSQQDFGNNAYLDNLRQTFYLCIFTCRANLNNCLQIIPAGWNINTAQKEQEIQQYLFSDEWVNSCWNQFLHFLQLFSNP